MTTDKNQVTTHFSHASENKEHSATLKYIVNSLYALTTPNKSL